MKELAARLILDTPFGGKAPVRVLFDRYRQTNYPALVLVSDDGIHEPIATATCNLTVDPPLKPFEFFCKDWSENEGMADWLIEQGIATDTGRSAVSGFVLASIMIFTPEYQTKIAQFAH